MPGDSNVTRTVTWALTFTMLLDGFRDIISTWRHPRRGQVMFSAGAAVRRGLRNIKDSDTVIGFAQRDATGGVT